MRAWPLRTDGLNMSMIDVHADEDKCVGRERGRRKINSSHVIIANENRRAESEHGE